MRCDLNGQTALVTGATGNLGGTIALSLAKAGADVAVHYHRNRDAAEQLVQQIEAMGRRALAVSAELSEREPVRAMRDAIGQQLGNPTIIVANAVSQVFPWQEVLEEDPDDYLDQFKSSVLQTVHLTQAFVPAMKAAGGGRYLAISTECVMQNKPKQSAYVSGKRGLDGVLRSLFAELAPHSITVNQVAPGWTISDGAPEGKGDAAYTAGVPMQRRGTAQDIANAVVFLASPQAGYITGAWLPVCGGNVIPSI